MVKNPPAMRETWVWSLGWDDPLEKGKVTHSSILAWRIPMDRGLAGYSPGIFRVGQDRATKHSTAIKRSQWMNSQAAVVNLTMSALTFNRCHWQVPLWSAMNKYILQIRSDQISCSVVSDSLQPHESQHTRPPYPSPTSGVHSDSRPSSQWCHPAISSSVVPFSSCPQSLPASEAFPMSQLFAWGGQSTGVSALASFLPKNTQDWSPL